MPDHELLTTILNSYNLQSSSGMSEGGYNWVNIVLSILFGIFGLYAFNNGRKEKNYKQIIIGIGLMGFPYFVSHTFLIIIIGAGLTSAIFLWHD